MTETPDAASITPPPASPPPIARRRRRRAGRLLLLLLALVIILPVAAAVAAFLTFDPNAYKAQIAAAVKQATGRDVSFDGPLAVKISWVPTITAQDVRLANIPGGSAPDMARIDSIETQIALLPLFQHEVDIQALVLRHPSILLERTADGQPNWLFQPAAPATAAGQPVTVNAGGGTWHVSVDKLEITDGLLTWRNGVTGRSAQLALGRASLAAQVSGSTPPTSAPLAIAADAVWQGVPVTLSGTTGPFSHLTEAGDQSPWPLHLTIGAAGASLTADGTITDPRQLHGYAIALRGTIPALEALAPLLPPNAAAQPRALPPIHGISLAANLSDPAPGAPRVTNLSLQAQGSDLSGLLAGLRLDSLSAITPALDQPATINVLGERNGLAFTLSGSVGPLSALLPAKGQPAVPLPVDLLLTAAQSNLHAQGTVADPLAGRGLGLNLAVQIADLARLSPLAGVSLPSVQTVSGTGHLSDFPQGLGQGLSLTALDLTALQGDLEGEIAVDYAGRPMVTSALRSASLDLDGLLGHGSNPQPMPTPVAPPAAPASLPPPPPPAAAETAAQPPKAAVRVIPDLPLPIAALRGFDASVSLAFASLHLGGTEYRALVTKVTLLDGLLSLAPSSVVVPGGEIIAAGQFDAKAATPHASLAMQAQNLAIAPLLAAFQAPIAANGFVQLFANLTASGASTRALAASVSGALGIAAVNGVIDGRALAALIRPAVRAARVIPPELLNAVGQVPLRCFALRLNATNGLASVDALVLDTSTLLLQGTGSVNFGQESLALALRPDLYLGQTELTVPLTLGGSFAAPHMGKVGSVIINERSSGGGLNGLFQSLVGGGRGAPPPVSAACAPALVQARNGQPGPAPTDTDTGLLAKPANLLQQLLHGQ